MSGEIPPRDARPSWLEGPSFTRAALIRKAAATGAVLAIPTLAGRAAAAHARGLASTPVRGGTLRMARNEEPQSFDPVIPGDNGSIYTIQQIFDQLTRINKQSNFVSPSLAESWHISADRKTYTFQLRKAKFSNGAPVTADDVIFSLKRTFDPKVCFYSFLFAAVKSIKKVDSSTVQLVLSRPTTPLLESLSVFAAAIVPEAVVTKDPKGFAENPIGSGAFALKQFEKGQFTHLVRNVHYWQPGKPYLDAVMMDYVPEDNTRILNLQANESDVATLIPYAQIATVDHGQSTRVQIEPLFRWDGIWLNEAHAPIGDKRVRQALNYATDKETLVQRLLFDNAEVANHMMPKHRYWRPTIKPYPYDIQKAKALIAASSVPHGFSTNLVVPTGDTVTQQIAQVVKQSWSEIGVNVTIQDLDAGTAATNWANGDYTIGTNWYVTSDCSAPDEPAGIEFDYGAPGGFKSAFANYKSAKASTLIHEASRSGSNTERAELFGELQQLVMDDAYGVSLFFSPARTGLRSTVQNFHTYRTGWWALEETWLSH
jgi:peptide/nickel transport system substrate-binding protein